MQCGARYGHLRWWNHGLGGQLIKTTAPLLLLGLGLEELLEGFLLHLELLLLHLNLLLLLLCLH